MKIWKNNLLLGAQLAAYGHELVPQRPLPPQSYRPGDVIKEPSQKSCEEGLTSLEKRSLGLPDTDGYGGTAKFTPE